jgi:MoaA/NifB/PqqE/SkfB family radical SAM enzyme
MKIASVLIEARTNFPRIIANLPDRLTYLDLDDRDAAGEPREKIGRVILSGGESLIDPVRTEVTYKVIDALNEKYRAQGGVKIVVQTTGDILTPEIVEELLARGIYMISIASTDRYHVGIDTAEKQQLFVAELTEMFTRLRRLLRREPEMA